MPLVRSIVVRLIVTYTYDYCLRGREIKDEREREGGRQTDRQKDRGGEGEGGREKQKVYNKHYFITITVCSYNVGVSQIRGDSR